MTRCLGASSSLLPISSPDSDGQLAPSRVPNWTPLHSPSSPTLHTFSMHTKQHFLLLLLLLSCSVHFVAETGRVERGGEKGRTEGERAGGRRMVVVVVEGKGR